jgi:ketosteroid isomerase-like protein
MPTDTLSVVEAVYAAWQARDLPGAMALMADDMVFALHVPREVLPIGGETVGKVAVGAALRGLLDAYDFLAYEPGPIAVEGSSATAQVHFIYRQKATGDVIDSRLRHRWSIEAGRARRLDEWHDLAAVTAFLTRVAANLAK